MKINHLETFLETIRSGRVAVPIMEFMCQKLLALFTEKPVLLRRHRQVAEPAETLPL